MSLLLWKATRHCYFSFSLFWFDLALSFSFHFSFDLWEFRNVFTFDHGCESNEKKSENI